MILYYCIDGMRLVSHPDSSKLAETIEREFQFRDTRKIHRLPRVTCACSMVEHFVLGTMSKYNILFSCLAGITDASETTHPTCLPLYIHIRLIHVLTGNFPLV